MPAASKLTGRVFDRLTVLGPAPKRFGNSKRCWRVDLIAKRTTSCGCRHDEVAGQRARLMTKHGRASNANGKKPSRTYSAWSSMWQRCTNTKDAAYRYYGAKGVRVAKRWKRFEAFLVDLVTCPPDYELERKNPFGNYTRANCIWATTAAQARNKCKTRKLTFKGISRTVIAWAEHVGISAPTLHKVPLFGEVHKRCALDWQTIDILTKPINREKQKAVQLRRWRPPLSTLTRKVSQRAER